MKFEKVSRFSLSNIAMPERKTSGAAGYDFVVAEDTVILPYAELYGKMNIECDNSQYYTIDEVSALTKKLKTKPTLVSTGMKCHLDKGTYLELSVRSSSPLKYWILMANGVGIIDEDYYNNPDNEGEIFFQLINLSPFPIKLQKGEAIGQGIIKPYYLVDEDKATGERVGGFGSTTAVLA